MEAQILSAGLDGILFVPVLHQSARGIFVANVAVHYIAEYLQKHAHDRRIFLVGYDLIEKNIAFLKVNVITFLISQKTEHQGYEGVYAIYRHIALKENAQKIF